MLLFKFNFNFVHFVFSLSENKSPFKHKCEEAERKVVKLFIINIIICVLFKKYQ